jgi:hypothetical protein
MYVGLAQQKRNSKSLGCLLLRFALQFSEPLLQESKLPALFRFFDAEWQVAKKKVLEAEFGVLVQLGFSLHEHPHHVNYHFVRLLRALELNPRKYLGESMLYAHQDALRDAASVNAAPCQVTRLPSPSRGGGVEESSPRMNPNPSDAVGAMHETGSVTAALSLIPSTTIARMRSVLHFRGAANALRNRRKRYTLSSSMR